MSGQTGVFLRVLLIIATLIAFTAFIGMAVWGGEGALSVPDRILGAALALAVLLVLLGVNND